MGQLWLITLYKFQAYSFILWHPSILLCVPLSTSLLSAWKAESFISNNGQQLDVLRTLTLEGACVARQRSGRAEFVLLACAGSSAARCFPQRVLCRATVHSGCPSGWTPLRCTLTSKACFLSVGAKLSAIGFTDVYLVSLKARREPQACLWNQV